LAIFHITYFSNHHRLGIIRKLTNSKFNLWKPFWNCIKYFTFDYL